MKKALALALLTALAARAACGDEDPPAPLQLATFNIENYPRSAGQVAGAFALIRELDVDLVAVQEITRPGDFARQARRRLGNRWRFVACQSCPRQQLGVLYDADRLVPLSVREHHSVSTYRGGKPALEARFRDRDQFVRVIVVHLKAGADHIELRRSQLEALAPIMRAAVDSGDRVVLLGDFNATSPEDRAAIAELAATADLGWPSRELECTSYWSRESGCVGTPLDHLLATPSAGAARARGPCESEGCGPDQRCPTFFYQVSDHCPVTLDL